MSQVIKRTLFLILFISSTAFGSTITVNPALPNNSSRKGGVKQTAKATSAKPKGKSFASFRVYVDKSIITIGEKVKYTMEIESAKDVLVQFPPYTDNLGGFAVKDFGAEKPKKSGRDKIIEKRWYILDTYTVGPYVIPPQTAHVTMPNGKKHELKSPEVFVEVKSVRQVGEAKDEGLRDIKKPLSMGSQVSAVAIIIAAVLLLCIIGAVGFIYYEHKLSKQTAPPPVPPHELALTELKRIEAMDLINQGMVKEYYYLVSNCLRAYIENQFQLRAPEQTTEEFIEFAAKSDKLKGRYIDILKEYLYHCDLVKYAKLEPGVEEIKKLMQTTREFINETKPEDIFTFSSSEEEYIENEEETE